MDILWWLISGDIDLGWRVGMGGDYKGGYIGYWADRDGAKGIDYEKGV